MTEGIADLSLGTRDRATLDAFVRELEKLHGEALLCAMLTGAAASPAYLPGRSSLTTLVILREVTTDALRETRGCVSRWSRRRVATPLLMDPLYIETARDVFPLEFLELADHHQVLSGRDEWIGGASIDPSHLRHELEVQARGKLLHLWEAYLEAGRGERRIRRLLLETAPTFETILRGMLYVVRAGDDGSSPHADPRERPTDGPALLAACEEELGVALPTFRSIQTARGGGAALGEPETLFDAYLREVRQLVRIADGL